MKLNYIDWLSKIPINTFITITLKQSILDENGGIKSLDNENIVKTGLFLKERINRAIIGGKKELPFLVFSEGDGVIKRRHLHIASYRPDNILFDDYVRIVNLKSNIAHWVNKQIDIRPIEPGTERNIISYSLKEGTDAFILEASCLPAEI